MSQELAVAIADSPVEQPLESWSIDWGGWVWRIFRLLGIAYLTVLFLLVFLENSLIFRVWPFPNGNWQLAPGFEDAEFIAADGTKLHGWFTAPASPRLAILMCHGNAGNVTLEATEMRWLRDECGAAVLAWDYRGYGKSEGTPDEGTVLADARAAREWLAKKTGTPIGQVVVMGRSLGGAVAIDLAADGGARGLVVESTFTSLPDVASRHYWWAPVRLLMRTQLNSLSKIETYRGPLLASHSRDDQVVPFDLGEKLFAACPSDRKKFLVYEGLEHNDSFPPAYARELKAFLQGL